MATDRPADSVISRRVRAWWHRPVRLTEDDYERLGTAIDVAVQRYAVPAAREAVQAKPCRRCHGYGHEMNPDPSLSVPPFPCRDCAALFLLGSLGDDLWSLLEDCRVHWEGKFDANRYEEAIEKWEIERGIAR